MTPSLSDDEIRRRVDLCASTIRKISERHRGRCPAPQLVVSEASLSQRARYDRRANTVRVGGPNVIASPNYSDDALVGLTAHEMGHWFHVHNLRFRRLDWIAAHARWQLYWQSLLWRCFCIGPRRRCRSSLSLCSLSVWPRSGTCRGRKNLPPMHLLWLRPEHCVAARISRLSTAH